MINILITGARGQLGMEFERLSSTNADMKFFFTDRVALDITNRESIFRWLREYDIDVVINCAAYTNVELAEQERNVAFAVNAEGPALLGEACRELNIKIIHISTDYVFDGAGTVPLTEDSAPNPISEYGASKLEGEVRLLDRCPSAMVFRASWLYSTQGNNFYLTMRRLGEERDELTVVDDQVSTPTYARILARDLLDFLSRWQENDDLWSGGVYHYSHNGETSWYAFATSIFKYSEINCAVHPVSSDQFPTLAARPAYSKMANGKIQKVLGMRAVDWEDALRECINASKYEHA